MQTAPKHFDVTEAFLDHVFREAFKISSKLFVSICREMKRSCIMLTKDVSHMLLMGKVKLIIQVDIRVECLANHCCHF